MNMEMWYQIAALSVGGVLGVNARYWLGFLINRWLGSHFPWATFTINVTGSFAIGFCTVFLARWLPHPHARLVVVVGFLGGYTTFSSYSLESLTLWEQGEHGLCLAYMFGSVAAGFAGVVLGTALGRGLLQSDVPRSVLTSAAVVVHTQAVQQLPAGGAPSSPSPTDDLHSRGRRSDPGPIHDADALGNSS
jgi:CrcB protein